MSNLEQAVAEEAARAQAVNVRFRERMAALKDEGLVDLKLSLRVSPETTVGSVIAILTNVLDLREHGRTSPLTLDL